MAAISGQQGARRVVTSRAAAEHISELETKSHEHIRYGDRLRCGGLHDRSQLAAAQEGVDYR
jgi:hypothetical protein